MTQGKTNTISTRKSPLTRFGTYGFLSALMATQIAQVASANDKSERLVRAKFEGKKQSRTHESLSRRAS